MIGERIEENLIVNGQSAVFNNLDLVREITSYLAATLPLLLTLRSAREALMPRHAFDGQKWIKSKKKDFATSIIMFNWACSVGCEFQSVGPPTRNLIFGLAASNGCLELLKWARERYPGDFSKEISYAYTSAAKYDHIEVLKYLIVGDHNKKILTTSCVAAASMKGRLSILEWIQLEKMNTSSRHSIHTWFDQVICLNATKYGHLHVLEWLRSLNPQNFFFTCMITFVCKLAAKRGYLELLMWFRSQDPPCEWDVATCIAAASKGHLHIIEWIYAQDRSLFYESGICLAATKGGYLRVLKFLRGIRPPCPWSKRSCLECSTGETKQWIELQED